MDYYQANGLTNYGCEKIIGMKNTIYYLSTCDTCKRIMKEFDLEDFDQIDIKKQPLSEVQIEYLYRKVGSYEGFFSKSARKYRALNLKEKNLSEADFKHYLLEDYTFLKRPVFIIDQEAYVGNSKKNIEVLKEILK